MVDGHSRYPQLAIDLKKLRYNIDRVNELCREKGVEVAGVIKGCTALPECVRQFAESDCRFIASSRLEQLEPLKNQGIEKPLMLIRIPMISEAADVVRITEISLNSDISVLRELNTQAGRYGRVHRVILMVDLGDLREGFWDREELLSAALEVENKLDNLELAGVGTNLGCYGAIAPTKEKLDELVECAEMIENDIGRRLDIISGGATTSLPRVITGDIPGRINQLRIGEGILLAMTKEVQELWGIDISDMYTDAFTIRAEVIEVKKKPTYPVGEIMYDAFGKKPVYEDRGIRKRALIALGRVDYGSIEEISPREAGITVVGASSDHTILDVEDAQREIKVGDIIELDITYASLVYVSDSGNVVESYI